ncbi:hypothetical protein BXZ70DRAFT_599700 [Cristinia sonorae]|uniref:F-box domain-containing protein n=1 Tax=Cristinia sonorae TaxID=1940300 RepID=A0A8K0XTH1_9AGAR|nr:hypothetical protein BXZ70DRAFT_599700 [Cristinia sonorae]
MATLLPQELIEKVLQHVYYNTDLSRPDYGTLLACCLICKTWSGQAQRMLFLSIVLNTTTAGSLITSTSDHTQALLASVRCLDLEEKLETRTQINSMHMADDQVLVESTLIAAITRCTGLYELSFRVKNLHKFSDKTVIQLFQLARRADIRPLRAVKLPTFGVLSPLLFQIMQIWPTIQFVRLGQELGAIHPRSLTPTFQLYELTLLRVPTRNVEAIEWLLSASIGHLRILHLRDEPGKAYDNIFQIHGPHLESLRLYNQNKRTSALLRMCPNLKEFVITILSDFLPLENLPESLEHLSFRNYIWAKNNRLVSVIDAIDKLPNLRVVSCDPNGKSHPDWSTLEEKCLKRGINLEADALPIFAYEDPVRVRRYPRVNSVLNFALMNQT